MFWESKMMVRKSSFLPLFREAESKRTNTQPAKSSLFFSLSAKGKKTRKSAPLAGREK